MVIGIVILQHLPTGVEHTVKQDSIYLLSCLVMVKWLHELCTSIIIITLHYLL